MGVNIYLVGRGTTRLAFEKGGGEMESGKWKMENKQTSLVSRAFLSECKSAGSACYINTIHNRKVVENNVLFLFFCFVFFSFFVIKKRK